MKKKELSRFAKLIDVYEHRFEKEPQTELGRFTEDEWCMILEECIKEGKTVDELLGTEQGDYWYD